MYGKTEYLSPMMAALYGRVSDADKQGDNFSIDSQLDRMREFCQAQGWDIVAELQERDLARRSSAYRMRKAATLRKVTVSSSMGLGFGFIIPRFVSRSYQSCVEPWDVLNVFSLDTKTGI